MKAKFEEKTYENYFNTELDKRSQIYFPLGQVQEGNLGFDASSFSKNRRLWKKLGHRFWFQPKFKGLELREVADEMERYLGKQIANMPQMKANLLFQYKRPELITAPHGREWHLWNREYFRYEIYQEQHNLLMHIHNTFNSKIHVIYAAPTTIDINELVTVRKNILDHSNFAKAVDLQGHHWNTYISSGTNSIACSEPEEIENINILEFLESLDLQTNEEKDIRNNREFIIDFSSKIKNIVSENEYISDAFNNLNKDIEEVEEYELLHGFLIMNNYRQLTGNQWLIKI